MGVAVLERPETPVQTDTKSGSEPERIFDFPSPAKLEAVKADALAWVQEFNPGCSELPPGVPGRAGACPVARGLGRDWYVGSSYAQRGRFNSLSTNRSLLRLPASVRRFVSYFDNGRYPELEESCE